MKTHLIQALGASFLFLFLITPLSGQCIADFENGVAYDGGFGGAYTNGVVADGGANGTNVLSIVKGPPEVWAGLTNGSVPVTIDLSTNCEICVDWYEPNATGNLLLKLEQPAGAGAVTWENNVTTTMGWGNYCFDTSQPDNTGNGVACGDVYSLIAIFPNFGTVGANEEYFIDNICITEPIPTAGEWGLIALSLSLLSLGLVFIRRTSSSLVVEA